MINKLVIDTQLQGINCDILIEKPVGLFAGDSGVGKSFAFSLIKAYCDNCSDINCIFLNYNNISEVTDTNSLATFCRGNDVLILDNAELYLTQELYKALRQVCGVILISHKTFHAPDIENVANCGIRYEDAKITIRGC